MKKLKIEITFDDYGNGIAPVIEAIHNTLRGHAPYINNNILLSSDKPFDGDSFKGDEVQLFVDLSKKNIAANDITSDLTLAGTMASLIAIKNMEKDVE